MKIIHGSFCVTLASTICAFFLFTPIPASAQTNLSPKVVVSPKLNQHQIFYTNWVRQYLPVRAIISTNTFQERRLLEYANLFDYNSGQRSSAMAAFNQVKASHAKVDERFEYLIRARVFYESQNPTAVSYAPNIANWKAVPVIQEK